MTFLVAAAASEPLQAAPDRTVGPGSFFANSLEAAPWNDGEVYGFGQEVGCEQDCARIYRSLDRGKSWTDMAPDELPPSAVSATLVNGEPTLLAEDGEFLYRSSDHARSFEQLDLPNGTYTLTAGTPAWLVITREGDDLLIRLDDGRRTEVPGPDLEFAKVYLAPNFGSATTQKVAIAVGISRGERRPRIAICDNQLACGDPRPLPLERAAIEAVFSPAFAKDSAIAINAITSVLLSSDGGSSFDDLGAPEPPAGAVQTSISGIAVSPDFDASRGAGFIAAAVNFSVPNTTARAMAVRGGLYVHAAGSGWQPAGRDASEGEAALAVEFAPGGSTLYGSFLNISRNQGAFLCLSADETQAWRACPDDPPPSSVGPGVTTREMAPSSSLPRADVSTSTPVPPSRDDELAAESRDAGRGSRVSALRTGLASALAIAVLAIAATLAWYVRHSRG